MDQVEKQDISDVLVEVDESLIQTPVKSIDLDSLAYLKIAQFASAGSSGGGGGSGGQLVGLEQDGVLSVSNCFSVPSSSPSSGSSSAIGEDGSSSSGLGVEYAVAMLRSFRDLNLDHEAVGWFSTSSAVSGTTPSGGVKAWLYSQQVIETQFTFQQTIAQSVLVVFDPSSVSTTNGGVSAFRLTDKFMELYGGSLSSTTGARKVTVDSLVKSKFSAFDDLYQSIPVQVTQSCYSRAFFSTFGHRFTSSLPSSSSGLSIPSTTREVERQLEELTRAIDAFTQEQYKWTRYQQQYTRQQQLIQHHTYKRKQENQKRVAAGEEPLPDEDVAGMFRSVVEPSRLDGVVGQARIAELCRGVEVLCHESRGKLSLVQGLVDLSSSSSGQQQVGN